MAAAAIGYSVDETGYPNGGFGWYRFRVELPDGRQPVSLFSPPILTGYEVYAEGVLIGKAGSTEPTRNPAFSGPEVFLIPTGRAGPHTLQIALRVWSYQSFATWLGGGPREAGSAIGYDAPLREYLRLDLDARALNYVNDYGYALIATLVGLTTLGSSGFARTTSISVFRFCFWHKPRLRGCWSFRI